MLEDFDKEYIKVEVGETVLELLPMGDLPATRVMDLLGAKQSDKLEKALELMKLAARDSKEFEREAEFISFNELIVAIDVWMDKSSDNANANRKALEKKSGRTGRGSGFKISKRNVEAELEMSEGLAEEFVAMVDKVLAENGIPVTSSDMDDEDPFEFLTDEQAMVWFLDDIRKTGINLPDGSELNPSEAMALVAKFFVAHGREEILISRGMLTQVNRSGKYFPIIDGSVKRRLGFTKSEARERFKDE